MKGTSNHISAISLRWLSQSLGERTRGHGVHILGLSPLSPLPKKLVGYCPSTGNAGKLFWGKHESGNLAITISKIPVEHHQYHHVDPLFWRREDFCPIHSLLCIFQRRGYTLTVLLHFTTKPTSSLDELKISKSK